MPAPRRGRALLSWGNAPSPAAFVGYRGYKTVSNIKENKTSSSTSSAASSKLGKKQSKAQFEATKKLYGKKAHVFAERPRSLRVWPQSHLHEKSVYLTQFERFSRFM